MKTVYGWLEISWSDTRNANFGWCSSACAQWDASVSRASHWRPSPVASSSDSQHMAFRNHSVHRLHLKEGM